MDRKVAATSEKRVPIFFKSDTELDVRLKEGKKFTVYQCLNGLTYAPLLCDRRPPCSERSSIASFTTRTKSTSKETP